MTKRAKQDDPTAHTKFVSAVILSVKLLETVIRDISLKITSIYFKPVFYDIKKTTKLVNICFIAHVYVAF